MNPHIEHRVRERAYRIWLDEGMPEGRADLHWEMASELVAGATIETPGEQGEAGAVRKPRKSAAVAKSAAPAAKKAAKPAKAAAETAAPTRTKKSAS